MPVIVLSTVIEAPVARLTSRITEYESPHRFVDEMVSGDFARLRHEHVFGGDRPTALSSALSNLSRHS